MTGIQFRDLDLEAWKEAACRIANHRLTMEEWEQYFGTIPHRETCLQEKEVQNGFN